MSWTKKPKHQKHTTKSPFTPKDSWHELSQGTQHRHSGFLPLCWYPDPESQVPCHVGSRVTPEMALSPPCHPATAPHQHNHHTAPALPRGRQQQEWVLTGDILSAPGPRGSQGTTVQRHDTVLTGHSRQLLFLSQNFFSGGMQTAVTGRFALSATEWGLLRPPEEGRRQVF